LKNGLKTVLNGFLPIGLRWATAALCLAAFFASLYHHLHPDSHPNALTALLFLLAAVIAVLVIRFPAKVFSQRPLISCIILVAIGLALRIASVVFLDKAQIGDFAIYHELAAALSTGDGYSYTGPQGLHADLRIFLHNYYADLPLPTAFRPPAYPFILAAVYRIFGVVPLYGFLLNALIGALTGVLLFALLYPIDRSRAFAAGLLWELYPASIFGTNLINTEITFTFLLVGLAYVIMRAMLTKSRCSAWQAAVSGVLLSIALLTRSATHLVLATALAVALSACSLRRRAVVIAITAICAVPLLFAWGMRNQNVFGHFETQPTIIGVSFFTLTHCMADSSDPEQARLEAAYTAVTDEFKKGEIGRKIGAARFRHAMKSGVIVRQLFCNFLRGWRTDADFLFWSQQAWLPEVNRRMAPLEFAAQLFYLVVLLCAAAGALQIKKIFDPSMAGILLLMLYMLGSAVLLVAFEGTPRYHFPLMAPMCVLAALGAGSFSRETRASRAWRQSVSF
jgi:hypothetical protein